MHMPVYVYEKSDTSGNGTTIGHRAAHHLNRFYLIYSSVLLIVRRVSAKESKEHFDFMLLKSMFGNKYQVFI